MWHATIISTDNNCITVSFTNDDGRQFNQIYGFNFASQDDLNTQLNADLSDLNQIEINKTALIQILQPVLNTQLDTNGAIPISVQPILQPPIIKPLI